MTYQSRGNIPCVLCGAEKSIGRKLCRPCYMGARKTGRLGKYPLLGPGDVFEHRIEKTDSCWLWTGTKNGYGYGIFLLPGETPVRAHRYSYERFVGKIPAGKIIMHTCDNPPCVNPEHLKIGTKAENNADCSRKGRRPLGIDAWNGKLTNKDVTKIRKSAERQYILAKRYDVSQGHISHIKAGKHRKLVK